ncbi:MAG: S9 family peptidase [Micropepsaceae bacterium]
MRGTYGSFVVVSLLAFMGGGILSVVDLLPRHAGAATPQVAAAAPGTAVTPGAPPVAAKKDHTVTAPFGATRDDPYYWLNEKENSEVLAYLEAENAYAAGMLKPQAALQDEIYAELEKRASLADKDVPWPMDGYWYETRYAEGADYPVIVRHEGSATGPETVVLDVPALAASHEQYFMRNWEVSPDGAKVAFAVDFKGDRICEIFVRDIATNAVTSTGIKNASTDIVWSADGKAIIYTGLDGMVRGYQARRHVLGRPAADDQILLQEDDTTFEVGVQQSRSRKLAIITVGHAQRDEILAVSTSAIDPKPVMLVPRALNVRASADHLDGKFYILTNDSAGDRKIVVTPDTAPSLASAVAIVPETKGRYIDDMALFDHFIAVQETHDAVTTIRIVDRETGAAISAPDFGPLGVATLDINHDAALDTLRVSFDSATTPSVLYDVDMGTGAVTELKKSPAWTWFDPTKYEAARLIAPAKDGTGVPVTLLWRKDLFKPGANPMLVYGYGAYGISSEPGFYRNFISLVDRGFVLAIAHVRGGRDMGDAWYQGGRMANKMNTFTDFIAATESAIASGYADPKKVYAMGGSAGGLLMGAVLNLDGTLYDGVVAQVPFVDVLTTMLDDTIPLTTFEYEEWGNPNLQEQYGWMALYSPYDNVAAKNYPALFVLTGLNDSQVGYFEPAKWVARLRATKTDQNPLLFTTNMGAGHSGNSGRTGPVADRAKVYAWLLTRAGMR